MNGLNWHIHVSIPPEKVQLSSELVSHRNFRGSRNCYSFYIWYSVVLKRLSLHSLHLSCFLVFMFCMQWWIFSHVPKREKKISPIGHLAKRNGLLNTQQCIVTITMTPKNIDLLYWARVWVPYFDAFIWSLSTTK